MSTSVQPTNDLAEIGPISDQDLERLALIRRFELMLLELFEQGALAGTTHTCVGQELVPVAFSGLLQAADFVFSNHRGHGHYLARYNDAEGLLAEIMGREGAVCGGMGGSQHIKRSNYLSTGVQGESVGVAVGMALSAKRRKTGGVALAYIGDGTWGQGIVYEALNLARLWMTPLAVVVENNGIAQTTPIELNLAGSIEARARAFDVGYLRIESRSIHKIREMAGPLLEACRKEFRPVVLECVVDRIGSHSKGDDTREKEEQALYRARDWYSLYRAAMPDRFEPIIERVASQLASLLEEVKERPLAGT